MPDKKTSNPSRSRALGLSALIEELSLKVPAPAVRSSFSTGTRRTHHERLIVEEIYPQNYAREGIQANLRFAMRYEPLDLAVIKAVFQKTGPDLVRKWVLTERTSVYARRAWFLYEHLTGSKLDIPDVAPTGYAPLLSPDLHITGPERLSRRHRITNNLLGDSGYCPLIRRTPSLDKSMSSELSSEARSLIESCDPAILARAVQYLYTQETKSSFAIEGEAPTSSRADRFIAALARAADFDASNPEAFVQLQNVIVDPRYAAKRWRNVQNYVSRTRSDYTEHVYYVCPKPQDVPDLMNSWTGVLEGLYGSDTDPICVAALASFGFVFIHPFEDGNGRIHRFLIHHVLGHMDFTPQGLLFPISAVMLRDRKAYDAVLETYSKPVMDNVNFTIDVKGRMKVAGDTADLYRFWDATLFCEYLYACVAETVRRDLREEIGFLQIFDRAVRAVLDIVDMPDRRASLLVRIILQGKGKLSKTKRGQFRELKAAELAAIEEIVRTEFDRSERQKRIRTASS